MKYYVSPFVPAISIISTSDGAQRRVSLRESRCTECMKINHMYIQHRKKLQLLPVNLAGLYSHSHICHIVILIYLGLCRAKAVNITL